MIDALDAREQRTAEAIEEAGRILSGAKITPTVEHVLELRNVIAGAYKLLDLARYGEMPDRGEVMAWQRRASVVLDARVTF